MGSKCEKCFYYKLCIQRDYVVIEEEDIVFCSIYENGIPKEIWNGKKNCEDYRYDEIFKKTIVP